MIQIGEIVDCLNTQPITFLIPTSGSYDAGGTFIPGGPVTQIDNVETDIQPANRSVSHGPEGKSIADLIDVTVADPNFFDTVNETISTQEYKLVYRGTVWDAHDVEDWRDNGYVGGLFVNTKKVFVP